MTTLFRSIAVALALSTALGGLARAQDAPERPNIVLIYSDDLGYGDVGCYGATKVSTPNIDRLAAEGRMFTDAHSASAVCTPSRYGLLTGQYAWRINCWGPLGLEKPLIIDTKKLTVPRLLKQHGYSTACIGKWHLGFGKTQTDWNKPLTPGPLEIGFDYYYGVPLVNSGPPFVYVEDHHVVGLDPDDPFVLRKKDDPRPPSPTQNFPAKHGVDRWAGARRAHQLYRDEMVGTTLTEKAIRWMHTHAEEKQDKPFFMYLATTNIHHPFTPHPRFKGTSQCGRYGDFIHELDWIVGEVLKTLDDLKLADNTLVIFTSDNGGMLNYGGQDAWKAGHRLNGDLLGFKFGAWEGGHRVPFIARWPGKIPAGTKSSQLICNVDMLAALVAILDHPLKGEEGPDSFDILPALLGDPDEPVRDHAILAPFWQTHLAIRKGKWIYIPARGEGGFRGKNIGDHTLGGPAAFKLTHQVNSDIEDGQIKKDAPPAQLYDLSTDLSQTKNVIRQHPEVAKKLSGLLKGYRERGRSVPRSQRTAVSQAESGQAATEATKTKQPNFVVIFTDDLGYGDLGCFGGKHVSTPIIDKLASEGTRLTSFYVAAPVCTPSRAALMTGCYASRVGMATGSRHGVLLSADPKGLNPQEVTMAEVLKGAGYATGIFGKWHLGDQPEFLPTRQGFDEFFGIPYSHDIHPFHPAQGRLFHFPPLPLLDGEKVIELEPDADFLTQRITERAIAFIEKHKQQPFFLYIPHPIPHVPLHASPKYMESATQEIKDALAREDGHKIDYNTRNNIFRQAVAEIDWSVGQIVDTLKKHDLDENTLLIFTSDNGPGSPLATAGPLRGRKGMTYEGGVREPTFIRWPGTIPAGVESDEIFVAIDLLPTFAKLAGAKIPTDRVLDGMDVSSALLGKTPSPREVVLYHGGGPLKGKQLLAVRVGKWKLHAKGRQPVELYDLEADIGERNNVLSRNRKLAQSMLKHIDAFENDLAKNGRKAGWVKDPVPLTKE